MTQKRVFVADDIIFIICTFSDVNKVQEGLGDKISNFLQWFASFVSGIIIGFVKGWKLALVILSVSPLLAIAGGVMTYVSIFLVGGISGVVPLHSYSAVEALLKIPT